MYIYSNNYVAIAVVVLSPGGPKCSLGFWKLKWSVHITCLNEHKLYRGQIAGDVPVPCCFGQLVLRLPVVCVQPEHEAASAQLRLRLLQLLWQVKHLARGVVRVLTIHTHTHAQFPHKSQINIFFSKDFFRLVTRLVYQAVDTLCTLWRMKRSQRAVCLRWGHVVSGEGNCSTMTWGPWLGWQCGSWQSLSPAEQLVPDI